MSVADFVEIRRRADDRYGTAGNRHSGKVATKWADNLVER